MQCVFQCWREVISRQHQKSLRIQKPQEAQDFFHFITGHRTLFSLTSTEAPGNFNLNGMGGFKTSGLCLFLQPHRFQQPAIIFDKMVTVGQQIADDLGGVLEDEYHHLLTPERLNYWKAELGQTSE